MNEVVRRVVRVKKELGKNPSGWEKNPATVRDAQPAHPGRGRRGGKLGF